MSATSTTVVTGIAIPRGRGAHVLLVAESPLVVAFFRKTNVQRGNEKEETRVDT
jgi:hypothetical protein